ncbi:MAG: prolipoprotein diacylglyceryl transferase [Planctomycetes bacterium]|nr:prolipoprotein diacylglyceryl transferase [Planctomycetota bacterium]
MPLRMHITPYSWLLVAAMILSAAAWLLLTRRSETSRRLFPIYLGGLLGAFAGAKLGFLFAEGWHYRDNLLALLSGKTIIGGLLGGYAGVEFAKYLKGHTRGTGDYFALIVPPAIILGRIGCLAQGCCGGVECQPHWWTMQDASGVHRWPAAAAELAFNAAFWLWAITAHRFGWARGNRFHVYLITYGAFRFAHEFLRDTQRLVGPISGYQLLAMAAVALGVIRWRSPAGNATVVSASR